MGTTTKDLFKYPCFMYCNGEFVRIYPASASHDIFKWQVHHYISQGWVKRNKIAFKKIEHLQKLYILPTQMHIDLHARHSKFKQKWGVDINELLYDAD